MLNPVPTTPIAASTIKSHGSESRSASNHAAVAEVQAQQAQTAHQGGVGLDAGSILANVNAEAATAGNRTILQTLALAVAAQLNLTRRSDETLETFFLRIAAALDTLSPEQQAALEIKSGLKALKIQVAELSAALKLPDSALAARLSAMAEAPLATPMKTAIASATTTYLEEGSGMSRAAETMAMVSQARSNADGNGLFSSGATAVNLPPQAADAKGLQVQLKSMFEPGVAETRMEIAAKPEEQTVLFLGEEPILASVADGELQQIVAANDENPMPAEASLSATVAEAADDATPKTDLRAEMRQQAALTAENNNVPTAQQRLKAIAREIVQEKIHTDLRLAEKQDTGDHRLQTLLTLKGIAEVITAIPAKAAELLMAAVETPAADKPAAQTHGTTDQSANADADQFDAKEAEKAASERRPTDRAAAHQPQIAREEAEAETERKARVAHPDPQALAKAAEHEHIALPRPAPTGEQTPFAYAQREPARDEFTPDAAEDRHARDHEDGDSEFEEPEDEDARRERLARKAVDDLLKPEAEPEPVLKITRDSTEADRAYALYQRMGGF